MRKLFLWFEKMFLSTLNIFFIRERIQKVINPYFLIKKFQKLKKKNLEYSNKSFRNFNKTINFTLNIEK